MRGGFPVRSVAIVGAGGPTGLAAAKYFVAEKAFEKISLFEQRDKVGGLWNYTPETSGDGLFAIPQTNPRVGLEQPVWRKTANQTNGQPVVDAEKFKAPIFISPIYERLETNIPKSLMGFSDEVFPPNFQLFPGHDDVKKYLESYARDIVHMIQFQTQVVNVKFSDYALNGPSWDVETVDLPSGKREIETYDAVVVASGHYSTPFIPDIPGLQDWDQKHPGSISHSKYYRVPEVFTGKKVIIVGNSASGLDISSQIASFAKSSVLLSQKSESYLAAGFAQNPNIEHVSQISLLDAEGRSAIFSDGRKEYGVDCIIFCTGYLYTMPFLRNLDPNPIGNGTRVENTWQHLFYTPRPTLAFLALPQKVIPFPLAEAQSAVLARVYSGRLAMPPRAEMEAWEESVIAERGGEGDFHTLKFPKDAEYINWLYDWAACVERQDGDRMPKRWGAWEYWARENFPAIRRAFVQRGEGRKSVMTLDDLDFNFVPHAASTDGGNEMNSVTDEKGTL